MAKPVIAILGRPNVGKSTLFNRLIGHRQSIVSPVEGVTRDRVYGTSEWTDYQFGVIDTGGYLPDSQDVIDKAVRLQAEIATEEADVVLLMVDARVDLTASDRTLAQMVLKSQKPYLLIGNKVDDAVHERDIAHLYELGLGDPILISAGSGRSIGDMLDQLVALFPEPTILAELNPDQVNLAIVGKPNVGKSSLMNALLREEKSIVTDIAGTTRDSIDSFIQYFNKTYRLIDTAGLRRKARIGDAIEYYSTVRTHRVISECDVAILMLDAEQGFGSQDRDIARQVMEYGKGLVVAVNKWDSISKDDRTMKNYTEAIEHHFKALGHYPILYISVLHNKRIWNVMEAAAAAYVEYHRKIRTRDLNDFIAKATQKYPPPAVRGKHLKIKYITQVHSAPPVFALFSNHPDLFPVSYRRYLENQLRNTFGFEGVSIKISFRKK